jgi:hypothetical protein
VLSGSVRRPSSGSLSAELNDVDPQTWLADVLARMPDHPARRIDDFLPWNWRPKADAAAAAPTLLTSWLCCVRIGNPWDGSHGRGAVDRR